MKYAMSDIHGCYRQYAAMLEKVALREEDTLYVLGDVVDRGEDGIRVLRDMMARPNVVPLLGNHDYTALTFLTYIRQDPQVMQNEKFVDVLETWLADGGEPTLRAFLALSAEEQDAVLAYLSKFAVYREVEAAGRRFLLAHTVPDRERMRYFDRLTVHDFLIGTPQYDKPYYHFKYLVTGHTPTSLIEEGCTEIYQKNNHIAIDCGAVFGGKLGCIRLDDLTTYYVT